MLLDGRLFQRLAAMIAREKNHFPCCLTLKMKYLPKTATVDVRCSARVCVLIVRRRKHDDRCFGCVRRRSVGNTETNLSHVWQCCRHGDGNPTLRCQSTQNRKVFYKRNDTQSVDVFRGDKNSIN